MTQVKMLDLSGNVVDVDADEVQTKLGKGWKTANSEPDEKIVKTVVDKIAKSKTRIYLSAEEREALAKHRAQFASGFIAEGILTDGETCEAVILGDGKGEIISTGKSTRAKSGSNDAIICRLVGKTQKNGKPVEAWIAVLRGLDVDQYAEGQTVSVSAHVPEGGSALLYKFAD